MTHRAAVHERAGRKGSSTGAGRRSGRSTRSQWCAQDPDRVRHHVGQQVRAHRLQHLDALRHRQHLACETERPVPRRSIAETNTGGGGRPPAARSHRRHRTLDAPAPRCDATEGRRPVCVPTPSPTSATSPRTTCSEPSRSGCFHQVNSCSAGACLRGSRGGWFR